MGAGTHVAIRPVRRTLCIFCLFSAVMVVVVNSLNYFSRKSRHISTLHKPFLYDKTKL